MENKRALYLIERSNMSDKDKEFLKTHIENYEVLLNSIYHDLELLRTSNEELGGLDSRYISAKENAIIALNNLYDLCQKSLEPEKLTEIQHVIEEALEQLSSIEAIEDIQRHLILVGDDEKK